jgi:hypothetical protein
MAKNVGREFGTMDDEQRRKFAVEAEASKAKDLELDFDDPRDDDNMGPGHQTLGAEIADPEHRDGAAAQLDDRAHADAVRKVADEAERRLGRKPER